MLRLSSGWRKLSGSEFQVDGPATAKRRRPTPFSRWRGTINLRWVAERKCWRPVTSAVSVQLSIKYDGAVPWRHRYMSTASLNRTRSVTSSQWSSSRSSRDKLLSNFRVLLMTRAAEFITLCNVWLSATQPTQSYNSRHKCLSADKPVKFLIRQPQHFADYLPMKKFIWSCLILSRLVLKELAAVTTSMSMSIKHSYSANNRRSNLRRWCVGD